MLERSEGFVATAVVSCNSVDVQPLASVNALLVALSSLAITTKRDDNG